MKDEIKNILQNASKKSGIPFEILYAIVMTESGGNTGSNAINSEEDSRGLFQINVLAHPDANSSQLFNPVYNTDYALKLLTPVYNKGVSKGLKGEDLALYVEKNGERPKWTTSVENNIRKNYRDISNISYKVNPKDGTIEWGNLQKIDGETPTVNKTTDGSAITLTDGTYKYDSMGLIDRIFYTLKVGAIDFLLVVILVVALLLIFGGSPQKVATNIAKEVI